MKTSLFTFVVAGVGFAIAWTGCATSGKTGALVGAGIGALAGQAIGGDTGGTLIGAAVGTGIGYMIGNEKDKKHAAELGEQARPQQYMHAEVGALALRLFALAPRIVSQG